MLLASSASSSNSNFLIPNATFVFELIMFIIVLGVVAKFILPPLQRTMDERDAKIRGALQASDEGHHEAERLDKERQLVLERAHQQAREVVETATREVERLYNEARQRGQAEYERAINAAQETLGRERERLQAEAMDRLESVVVVAAEHIVGVEVDLAKHQDVIARAIAEAGQRASR